MLRVIAVAAPATGAARRRSGLGPGAGGRLPGRAGPEGAQSCTTAACACPGGAGPSSCGPGGAGPSSCGPGGAGLSSSRWSWPSGHRAGRGRGHLPVAAAHRREPEPDRGRLPVRLAAGRLPGHGQDQRERPAFRAGRAAEAGRRRTRRPAAPAVARPGDSRRRIRRAQFTATAVLASGHTWRYQGRLHLDSKNRHWWVSWSPAAIYPGLRPGDRFVLSAAWPARAQVLAADGTVLSSPAATARSGSLALLTGNVVAATAARRRSWPPVQGRRPDRPGRDRAGLPAAAGGPASLTIRIEGPGHRVRRHRGPLPGGGGEARADEHRHADTAGRVAGRVLRRDGQAG